VASTKHLAHPAFTPAVADRVPPANGTFTHPSM
jgi:hypothetical protein